MGKKTKQEYTIGEWIDLPFARFKITILDYIVVSERINEIKKGAFYFVLNNRNRLASDYASSLVIAPLNSSAKTVSIKLRDYNSDKAADIVNAIANEFITFDVERNSAVAEKVLDFINHTLLNVESLLSNSEDSLEFFKRHSKIMDPNLSINQVYVRMMALQQQLYDLDLQISTFDDLKANIQTDKDITELLLKVTGTYTDAAINDKITELQKLLTDRDKLLIQVTTESEYYKSLDLQIQNQKKNLIETINNEEFVLKTKRKAVREKLDEFEAQYGQLPEQEAHYIRLERIFNINEKFYSLLLEKKAEFSITRAGYVPENIILEPAISRNIPVSPNKTLVLSASLMFGFICSFLLIISRYLFYNEIVTLEEISQYTDAALLGIVPKYKREIPISQLLVDKNPKSIISEAFRSIRTNLQFISSESGSKVMAVTSTISGEGKTFNEIGRAHV